jgi:aspartate 1-decarboxylase
MYITVCKLYKRDLDYILENQITNVNFGIRFTTYVIMVIHVLTTGTEQ